MTVARAIDGHSTRSGTRSMMLRAEETIDPQLGVGGWASRPMKLRPDSSHVSPVRPP